MGLAPSQAARLAATLAAFDEAPANRPILDALARDFTLQSIDDSTLGSLLEQIRMEAHTDAGDPIPIFVNPTALAEVGVDLSDHVQINLPNVPLRTTLRLLLKAKGLAYCVRDGVLIISSHEDVQQELLEQQNELVGKNPEKYTIGRDGLIERLRPDETLEP